MKKSIHLSVLFLLLFAFQAKAQTETRVFSGAVGESRVQMTIQRSGNELKGTYFYKTVGKDLKISGSMSEDGNFTLTETAPDGTKTGTFSGTWGKSEDGEEINLNGTWENPQKTKSLEFFLTEQMIFFTNGGKIITKNFVESSKPKMYEMTAEYPELSGVTPAVSTKFNLRSKTMVMTEVQAFRKDFLAQTAADLEFFKKTSGNNSVEISYDTTFADNEIVSILFGTYYYTGGAHPNGNSFTLNYDLKNNRELKLADIFKPNSNFLKILSDYCIEQLHKDLSEENDDEQIRSGAGADLKNYDSWNVTKKGIQINFDSYQVAPYVAGPQEVTVPFEVLKGVLRSDFAVMK